MSDRQFFFAWTNEGETFGPAHQVYEEEVYSFTVTAQEGECALLNLTIRNPRIGLLNAGRKLWCWLSHIDEINGIKPIFHGRLVGIPNNVFMELVELVFVAKPTDYADQRRTLADSMKVLPMYDPVFVDPNLRDDPDTVLEGWPCRWAVSRGEDGGALTVTASDIILGEDGTEAFSAVPFDSISLSISGTPVTSINVKAAVGWTQKIQGPSIDLGGHTVATYTGQSLISSWPKPGSSLGGGWMATNGTYAVDRFNAVDAHTASLHYNWQNRSRQHTTGDTMSVNVSETMVLVNGPYLQQTLTLHSQPGVVWAGGAWSGYPSIDWQSDTTDPDSNGDTINIPLHFDATWMVIPQSLVETHLTITYETGRTRQEHCNFIMTSDIQPVLSLPGDFATPGNPPDTEILEIQGVDVTVAIDGVTPLADPSINSYFPTDRGIQSVEYLLMRARARLLAGARIVQCSWRTGFYRALGLTCRKNASLTWEKLPGGIISGKIVGYTIYCDGDSGSIGGTVTIAATVGHGGTVTPITGEPDWVDDDYVDDSYQVFLGATVAPTTGDVTYSPPVYSVSPDAAMPYTKADVVISEAVHGNAATQLQILLGMTPQAYVSGDLNTRQQFVVAQNAQQMMQQAFDDNAVWIEYKLKPADDLTLVDGHDLEVQPLVIPKTVDLEADSLSA